MLKLMKYEIERRKQFVLIFLIVLIFLDLFVVFGLYKGGLWLPLAIVFSVIIIAGTYLMVFFDGIRTFYQDLNNSEGYMLFLTPNNSYKIIGAKMLVNFIELLFFIAFVVIMFIINYSILKSNYIDTSLPEIQMIYKEIAGSIKLVFPTTGHIFLLAFVSVLQWSNAIILALLSIALTKTILSNSKASWLISLCVYIFANTAIQFITTGIMSATGFIKDVIKFTEPIDMSNFQGFIVKYVLLGGVIYLVYISIFFFITGRLLNKRIDI